MLLKDKVAVIYGAGEIGAAVAREFCALGATVVVRKTLMCCSSSISTLEMS
jgi:NAD(P)-dependent dehydrogenase (short-subunit alcohol dehydrogenase family)